MNPAREKVFVANVLLTIAATVNYLLVTFLLMLRRHMIEVSLGLCAYTNDK